MQNGVYRSKGQKCQSTSLTIDLNGAQAMTLSVTLGLATLYYTWRLSFLPPSTSTSLGRQVRHDSLRTAAFTDSPYCPAGLVSICIPGQTRSTWSLARLGFRKRLPLLCWRVLWPFWVGCTKEGVEGTAVSRCSSA